MESTQTHLIVSLPSAARECGLSASVLADVVREYGYPLLTDDHETYITHAALSNIAGELSDAADRIEEVFIAKQTAFDSAFPALALDDAEITLASPGEAPADHLDATLELQHVANTGADHAYLLSCRDGGYRVVHRVTSPSAGTYAEVSRVPLESLPPEDQHSAPYECRLYKVLRMNDVEFKTVLAVMTGCNFSAMDRPSQQRHLAALIADVDRPREIFYDAYDDEGQFE